MSRFTKWEQLRFRLALWVIQRFVLIAPTISLRVAVFIAPKLEVT